MTSIDHLGAKIAKHLSGSIASHIAERRKWLSSTAAADAELSTASYSRIEARKQAVDIARAGVGRAEDAFRKRLATEKDVLAAKARLKDEREQGAKLDIEIHEIALLAQDSRAVLDAVNHHLGGLKWPTIKRPLDGYDPKKHKPGQPGPLETEGSAPDIRIVQPDLPEVDLRGIVTEQRAQIGRLRAELEDVDLAPDRIATTKRVARQRVEELAARGAPTVSGAGEAGGRLRIAAPSIDIGAAPASRVGAGHIPRADDALALIAWAMPERAMEAVEADIEQAYLGIETQMDPHEKQRRKREIKAEILAAERIECAAIWALIEQGDDTVRFRPDTDPRALLGIA